MCPLFIELKVKPMSKLNSKAAEALLNRIVVKGNCWGEVPVSAADVVYLIREEHRQRYENAVDGMARDGYESLETGKSVIVDYFLGVDCVLNVDGTLVGVDVTVNPDKVDWKYRKLWQLKDSLQFCGIDRTIVLYLDIKGQVSGNEEYTILFKLLDAIDELNDKDRWVDIVEFIK